MSQRFETVCCEMDNQVRLWKPLLDDFDLWKRKLDMDKAAVPKAGRVICMNQLDYSEQYEAGINRLIGFDILWR